MSYQVNLYIIYTVNFGSTTRKNIKNDGKQKITFIKKLNIKQ